MAKTEVKHIFSFNKLTTACCKRKSKATLSFQEFEKEKSLWAISLLDNYIEHSKSWRQGQQKR